MTTSNRTLLLRSLLFTVAVPGAVVAWLPLAFILPPSPLATITWTPAAYAALLLLCVGIAVLLWCIVDFMVVGRGTLAPVDPPALLVHNGLYRYVRNPMYLGALLVLLGEVALFRSAPLLTYTVVWFAFVNLFVMFVEEPGLRRRFDGAYDEYCRRVGRWWPRRFHQ